MKNNKLVIFSVITAILGLLVCLCCGVLLVFVSKLSTPGETPDLLMFVDVDVPEDVRNEVIDHVKSLPNLQKVVVIDNEQATEDYLKHLKETDPDNAIIDYLDSPIIPHTLEIYLIDDWVTVKEGLRLQLQQYCERIIEEYNLDDDAVRVI